MANLKSKAVVEVSNMDPEIVVKRRQRGGSEVPAVRKLAAQRQGQGEVKQPSLAIDEAQLHEGERGWKAVRKGVPFEEIITGIVGGSRLAILVVLAARPHFVSEIQSLLGAKRPSHVTEELQRLMSLGIVTWHWEMSRHVYSLTKLLGVFRRPGMVQFVVPTAAGHWAVLHFDEGTGGAKIMPPPAAFIDTKSVSSARSARENTGMKSQSKLKSSRTTQRRKAT